MAKDKNFRFYWEESEKKDPNFKIEIPGFKKDEITVNITDNSITVSASKKSQKIEKDKGFYRAEASASSFSRSIALPHKINAAGFEIAVSDGAVILKRKKKKAVEAK